MVRLTGIAMAVSGEKLLMLAANAVAMSIAWRVLLTPPTVTSPVLKLHEQAPAPESDQLQPTPVGGPWIV